MSRLRLLLLLLLVVMSVCHVVKGQIQQKTQIKGHVADAANCMGLQNVSILLLREKDSSLAASAFTDAKGGFILNIPIGNYQLHISHLGYTPHIHAVKVFNKTVNLGAILIQPSIKTLGLIEIVQQKSPVIFKKDTIEYNADYYKTRDNAMLGDILKQLSGVLIKRDGSITINGEAVKRILVDGRTFFENNTNLAVNNLPADIIDKVQVIDQKTAAESFSGIQSTKREKAINVTTKKGRRNNYVGQLSAGYGSNGSFAVKANVNRFEDTKQISLLANGDNINGYQDDGVRRGGDGITRTWGGGVNYSKDLSKTLKVNGSYMLKDAYTPSWRKSARENLLPDTTYYYNQDNYSTAHAVNHSLNMRMDFIPDSTFYFTVGANINYTTLKTLQQNRYESQDGHHQLVNNGVTELISNGKIPDVTTTIFIGKRFGKPGRTLSGDININTNKNNQRGSNRAYNHFVEPGGQQYTDTINQSNIIGNTQRLFGANLTYTEPVLKDRMLQLTYSVKRDGSSANKQTYDFNAVNGDYNHLNDSLSNIFETTSLLQTGEVGIRTQKAKYNYSIGLGLQHNYLYNNNVSKQQHLQQSYLNYIPGASFNYIFSNTKELRFQYLGRTGQPIFSQLQPVLDNSNPLYIQLGNPGLKPAFTHELNIGYMFTNPISFYSFSGSISSSLITNNIVNAGWFDTVGRQVSQPINVNGAYRLRADISNGIPLKSLKTAINAVTAITLSRDISYINNTKGITCNLSIRQNFNFNYVRAEVFDLNVTTNINYNQVQYTIQPASNNNYFNCNLFLSGNLNLPLGFVIGGNLDYLCNTGRAAGYNQGATIVNVAVSKSLFRRKQALMKLQGFDLLNRNLNIVRNIGENYIEDVQTRVLQRFFLVSFTYFIKPAAADKN